MTCIGDSNELQEGPQLDALFDRFMLRTLVPYIADKAAFQAMLTAGPIVLPGTCDLLSEQAATAAVSLTTDTVDAITALRYSYNSAGFEASDRRWRQSISLIKASAHLSGRIATEPDDLEVLEHVLWKKPDERVNVAKLVQHVISPDGAQATLYLDNAREIFKRIPDQSKVDGGVYLGSLGQSLQDLAAIVTKLKALPKSRKVNSALAEAQTLRKQVGTMALTLSGVEQ